MKLKRFKNFKINEEYNSSEYSEVLKKFEDKCKEAQEESKEGFVQHVLISGNLTDGIDFEISDWYDSSKTVASYENGVEIFKEYFESLEDVEEWIFNHVEDDEDYDY